MTLSIQLRLTSATVCRPALCAFIRERGGFQRRLRLPVSDIELDASNAKCTNGGSGGSQCGDRCDIHV